LLQLCQIVYKLNKVIHQDLKSNNLSLNEANDMAQNHPHWRLTTMFDATHC